MSWFEENSVAIIGWVGTLVLFAFLFGKRLSKLETTDATLVVAQEKLLIAQEKLSDAVASLSAEVNGHHGNLALAEALKEFFVEFGRIGTFDVEELARTKNNLALGYPAEFETTTQLSRKLEDVLIVDVDAHHYESEHMSEILPFMENDVLKQLAISAGAKGGREIGRAHV